MPVINGLVDGTIPVAEDFNGNYRRLNQAIGVNTAIVNYAPGDLLYASATDTLVRLPAGNPGDVLTMTGGLPAWTTGGAAGGGGTWQQRNLQGTLSTTALTASADVVVLRGPSSVMKVHESVGAVTIDPAVAGLNGRDQVGGFTANQDLHAYWISNGTFIRGVWADSAPPVGPDLTTLAAFAGYTSWAYLGAFKWTGASAFIPARVMGSRVYYETREVALNAGTATTEATVSVASAVPAAAGRVILEALLRGAGSNSTATLRYITAKTFWSFEIQTTGFVADSKAGEVPNVSQQVFYQIVNTAGVGSFSVNVLGYTVSNGGD